MAKSGMVEQARGWGPRGEKRARIGLGRGEDRTACAAACEICTVLKHRPRCPRRGTGRQWRVALVDDNEATLQAATQMMRTQRDGWEVEIYHPCRIAGETAAPKGLPHPERQEGHGCAASAPDVVLIGLPEHDGARLACVRNLKALAPDLPVLMVSSQCDKTSIGQYCMAGANGWLTKPLAPKDLGRALRSAAQGTTMLCPRAVEALLDFLHEVGKSVSSQGLPQRQEEILVCLGANLSNKEIAQRLGVSPQTVHVQVSRLLRKASVHTRRQLVKKLLGAGME